MPPLSVKIGMISQIYKTFTLYAFTPIIVILSFFLCGDREEFKKFYDIFKKAVLS